MKAWQGFVGGRQKDNFFRRHTIEKLWVLPLIADRLYCGRAIFGNAVMRDMNISTQLADDNGQAPQYSEQAISSYPSE